MYNIDIDGAIEHVKLIADNIRCATCDRLEGYRYRYSCGHSTCDWCVANNEDCQICCTTEPSIVPHKLDNNLTQRVQNATTLMKECQMLFHTDVYQRRRISEQLRIEKELFPRCIQAPVKYENKRKSALYSIKNKENQQITTLPGEQISPLKQNIMENSVKYVEQWLNKNHKDVLRKPFSDLNVNTPLRNNNRIFKDSSTNQKDKIFKKNIITPNADKSKLNINRKRSHVKVTNKTSHVEHDQSKNMCVDYFKRVKKDELDVVPNNYDNNESGIFMDNDPIVIDDSQETYFDKDKEAWLAVLKANENVSHSTSYSNLDFTQPKSHIYRKDTITISTEPKNKENVSTKVPFYKRSVITETCKYCNNEINKPSKEKEVNITVDSIDFVTTVKIIRNVENKKISTSSVLIQTDISEAVLTTDENSVTGLNIDCNRNNVNIAMDGNDAQSQDLFLDEKINNVSNPKESCNQTCLIIEETDSDTDIETSLPMPVRVDVHRSCDSLDYGALSEVMDIDEHAARSRRPPRGYTPTSTDSSDKENFNPNRIKKRTPVKKKCTKPVKVKN